MTKFSSIFAKDRPTNLLLMPSFPNPDFVSDGVHLSPQSGLEYLFFLFDSARTVIEASLSSPEVKISSGTESTRLLEDRVMALEQDHRRLNTAYEMSEAIAAERSDFHENVRNEVFFMVSGLPAIKDLRGRDWMDKAIADVQGMIRTLLGKDLKVVVVHNATGRRDTETRYSVRMEYASESQEVRTKFGSFFIGGQDRRPTEFRSISVSNKVTPGTQIRIMILKVIAKRYQARNPEGRARVVGYEARPVLKVIPPESASDKRAKSYHFIEAIRKFPTCFTASELRPIYSKARVHFKDRLRQTFVVLDDDFSPASAPSETVTPTEAVPDDLVDQDGQEGQVITQAANATAARSTAPPGGRKRTQPGSSDQPERQRARH